MGLDHGLVRGKNCFLCLFFRIYHSKTDPLRFTILIDYPRACVNYVLKKIFPFMERKEFYTHTKKYRPHSGDFDIGRVSNDTVNTGDCATFHRVVVCARGGDSVG